MIKFFVGTNICSIFVAVKNRTYLMNLKNIVFALISVLVLTSCASGYSIEGSSSVSQLDGKMLFVKVPSGAQMVNVDSAEVVHGLFQMEGEIDSTVIASLYMDDESIMPLVVEEGNIRIRIDNARITVSGTPLNDKLYAFVGKKNSLDDRAYEVERMESRLIMDGMPMEEVEAEVAKERDALSKELDELVKGFIQENYENVLGPGVFIMMCNGFPYPILTPVIEEIVDAAPDCFKNHVMVKEYMEVARQNMEKLKTER